MKSPSTLLARAALVTSSLFLGLAASLQAAPPANDNFANATVLALDTAVIVNNAEATQETDEPNHSRFGRTTLRSIWYQTTPTFSGYVELDTAGSTTDTVIAVYKGTAVNKLTLLDKADDNSGGGSLAKIRIPVVKGVKYAIALDGFSGTGNLQIIMRPLLQHASTVFEAPLRFTSTFSGAFLPDNGKLSLTLTDKGSVSGKVYLGNKVNSFVSAITIDKTIPIVIVRPDRLPVFITVSLDTLATGQLKLAAAVVGVMGDKTLNVTAHQAPKFNNLSPCPRAGNYNYRISTLTDAGFGLCRLSISSTGLCKGTGFLGDGTPFTYSAPLLNDAISDVLLDIKLKGLLHHHTPLYGGKGQVTSSVSLNVVAADTQVTGSLGWFRPPAKAIFLPLGLESQTLALAGKNYTPPAANTRVDTVFNANGGSATFAADSTGLVSISQAFTLSTTNTFQFAVNNPNAVTLKLDAKTGIVTGGATYTGQTKSSPLRAILLPTGTPGVTAGFYGYNLRPERGGSATILSP
ncbi:hypothetical protein [Prosthecobacter dejongeii]|uniref:Uncharacterized protein n=1 Tax=Prosthecobacter dejongeii TaxID=48465 RepID=A0A7W7YQ75_9BACT|nr:hypothetical protein [Prosthecobacter dejongeii]MBB5040315.1 hypothetical protein [Prosthecobacter dejongeii]